MEGPKENKRWTWPKEGTLVKVYQYLMLLHFFYYLFFVIGRVAFEYKDKPHVVIVYLDFYMNIVYLVDMFRCFTEPYTQDGKVIMQRRRISIHYVKTWFFIDLYCFYPLTFLKFISEWEGGNLNSMEMFLKQNYMRLPRFYSIMLIPQIVRARNSLTYLKNFLKEFNFKIEYQNLIITFIVLIWILHVTGCFWFAASGGDVYSYENWVTKNGLTDDDIVVKYISSMYWATVTCTTVGYGDILPMNGYEMIWAMAIIVFGVAVFSYILSDLSSKFSEITRANASNQERIQQID